MNPFAEFRKNLSVILQVVLVCLLVGLLVVFVVVMCFEPRWIFDLLGLSRAEVPETVAGNSKYEVLKFIGISMGGVLIALQALIANKRANAMDKTAQAQADAAQAQADAAKAQARAAVEQTDANRLTERGQRQERLKNAIEHLGHESDSVRMGGAYELFHLAEDTKDLRRTVFDILCAHIRRTTGENEYIEKHSSRPSEEIQSLLTLLFVQRHEVFKGLPINLRGSWLNGAELLGARLRKVNLNGASLQGADIQFVSLQEAQFYWACLQSANLAGAHLQKAYLLCTDLRFATLGLTWMQGAILTEANLQGASLIGARLQGAYLGKTRLHAAFLSHAALHGADLRGAQLQEACLDKTILKGVTSQENAPHGFENRIRSGVGRANDLNGVVFEGGLSQQDLESSVRGLPDEKARELRDKLISHVGRHASHELPRSSGAIVDRYTEEEAENWIVEYKEAMSGDVIRPGDDS